MSFKWEAKKLFSPWPLSASKVPTCASRTYSRERKLPPPCQSATSIAYPLPIFQKMGFWCVQRKRFWGRKLPFFQRKCICPAFYWICHSTELSVSPALKGNSCLKINLRHLQMHSVYWRLPFLPVNGLRWSEAFIASQECPLLISSGLLGEHKLTCALEAGFISCLPAMIWKFWWTLESFTQTFGFNECM